MLENNLKIWAEVLKWIFTVSEGQRDLIYLILNEVIINEYLYIVLIIFKSLVSHEEVPERWSFQL